jgi:fructokinase
MFATVGEALVDLIEHADGRYEPCLGGSVCNFTRALALQGQPVRYLNPLSADTFGDRFEQCLLADGVDLALAERSACPTSLAVISMGTGGIPSYTFHRQHVADRDVSAPELVARLPVKLEGIHTGGLALVPDDWAKTQAVLAAAQQRGAVVSVDANLRLKVVGNKPADQHAYLQSVQAAMKMAHIVKLSDEDVEALAWLDKGLDAVIDLLLTNPLTQLVALTLGANGAIVANRLARVQLPVPPVAQLEDTVGAGDCFQAGLLAWLSHHEKLSVDTLAQLSKDDLASALRHAMAAAAINVQRKGCQPPTWDEARAWMAS